MFQRLSIFFLSSLFVFSVNAWQWSDLWMTKDQRAQALMKKENYVQARDTFQRYDWKASAAFRAKDYKNAAKWFSRLHDEESYYNAGNAFAFLGEFEKALQAYDQTLALNPKHKDAIHNKKIVEQLLKKQKANNQKNRNQQGKDQQSKDQQSKDQQSKDQQGKDPQGKDQQGKDQQSKDQQGKDPQENDQRQKDPQEQNQNNGTGRHPERSEGSPAEAKEALSQDRQATKTYRTPEQENPSWLNYIPDEPGGLLREKFLRDYLKRHQEND
jgi:Ca-activated chloride channel family protein